MSMADVVRATTRQSPCGQSFILPWEQDRLDLHVSLCDYCKREVGLA